MEVLLTTYGGDVGRVAIPPFKMLPEVLVWGSRTFQQVDPKEDGTPVYREVCAFVVLGDLLPDSAPKAPFGGKPPFPELGVEPVDRTQRVSTSGQVATLTGPAPDPEQDATGQHKGYWVLSEEERAKGFVRPVRSTYRHLKCGAETRMGTAIAETYARDPGFYQATFCVHCGAHFPVGEGGEFVWSDGSGQKVGT